ncbi:CRISPR-associated endonuclease Cas2 [Methanosphaera cuniculi]|uniref:CRISPR-associated endonuclease Cas2 n=1 Tax=Methanosphaera cuniculi TaxID=1077256 RepID=UPI0026E9227F|nr:CRISPR-associated endonuclease Cas2 [Methanosphaera cuniculi]
MYILIIYDIKVERINKVYKFLKTHLTWIQNSVFEGEITKAEYKKIEQKLKQLIDEDEDSIIIYNIPEKYMHKKIIGIEKNPVEFII